MTARRFDFLTSLLDCILFECGPHIEPCTPAYLADCFDFVASMCEDYQGRFDLPCDVYIRRFRLDTPEGLTQHIDQLSQYGSNSIFPYDIVISQERRSLGKRDVYYNDSSDDEYNGGYTEEFENVPFVPLPCLVGHEVEEFLFDYAVLVPRVFHNDIAVMIQNLRDQLWDHKGSGGTRCWLENGMVAAKKYTKDYNTDKRMRSGRLQYDEMDPQQEYVLQQQQLRQQQLDEAARRERERARQEEERLKQERVAEEQRQQRIRRQEEAAKAQRNAAITDYMYKLQESQAATNYRKEEVESVRQILEQVFRDYFEDSDIEVQSFGSFASGLCTMNSDADFTVLFHGDYDYYPSIDDLADALHDSGYHSITTIPHARVPIASLMLSGINVDLNIAEPMGVQNSELIATYSGIDDRFTTLWFSIKQIAKKHGILSGSTGFLSSYALAMMLIVYLQDQCSSNILPRLQQEGYQMNDCIIDGYNCSYDWSTDYTNYGSNNPDSPGQLLVNFCHYFGYTFNYASQEVNPCLGRIQMRSFTPPARSRTDRRPKSWPICILDPFMTGRNVAGNCTRDSVLKIRDCFRSACDALKDTNINKAFKR
ncbi:hypothetical protein BGW39_005592 [Mortierella sp. 14UC]|nr:hypothetical protein BGW39_005592 [Mortierella sp. 14UC]